MPTNTIGGVNQLGTPDIRNYALGRGRLFIARLDSSDVPYSWRDVGNASKVNYKVQTTEMEHQSSRAGVKDVDAVVITERKVTGSFMLDEIDFNNIALLTGGTAYTAQTNAAVAGFAEYQMIPSVVMGRWYDIRDSAGVRAYNVTAGDLTVEKSGSPDTAMVLGTDYTLDSDMGRIFILATGSVVVAGDAIDVTLAAAAGAKTLDVVKAFNDVSATYAIKFLSLNPVSSDAEGEYQWHKCRIRASSDDELVGDKFRELGFEFTSQRSSWTAVTASPYLTVTTHTKADNDGTT